METVSHFISALIGIALISSVAEAFMHEAAMKQVLRVITKTGKTSIRAKRLAGQKWYEIDDRKDLAAAEILFAEDTGEQAERLRNMYGGYWRFPQLLDFCYLVNPFFPSSLIN